MSDNNFFEPLSSPLAALERVRVIYWQSGTVRLFLKLAILFVVPATCLLIALIYTPLHHHEQNGGFWYNFGYFATIMGSQSLIRSTLGAVAEGAIAVVVADLYLRRTPRWFTCLQKASSRALTLLMTGLVAGVAVLLGYFFFYLPGLFLKMNFMLVVPVVVLEDEISVFSALGRSWDLVKGERLFVLKCFLALEVLYWLSEWCLQNLLRKDDGSHPYFSLAFHILAVFPKSIFVPAFGILKAILYIHLMVIKENLTEDRFSAQIDQGMMTHQMPLLEDQYDDVEISFEQPNSPVSSENSAPQFSVGSPIESEPVVEAQV